LESEILSNDHIQLKVEPKSIIIGPLKPGNCGNATLMVTGGPGNILVHNDRLILTPTHFGDENAEIQVTTSPGSPGELIWDDIIVKGDRSEVTLIVTARWEGLSQEEVISNPLPTGPAPQDKKSFAVFGTNVAEVRPWTGRRCSKCQRNFAYDADTHDWEHCTCSGYQIVINMSGYIVQELRHGIKYIPSYIQEVWNVMFGKEKW